MAIYADDRIEQARLLAALADEIEAMRAQLAEAMGAGQSCDDVEVREQLQGGEIAIQAH